MAIRDEGKSDFLGPGRQSPRLEPILKQIQPLMPHCSVILLPKMALAYHHTLIKSMS